MRSRMTGVSTLLSSNVSAISDVALLRRGLADEELARLAVVVGEALRTQTAPSGLPRHLANDRKPRCGRFARALATRIWLIVHPADRVAHRHVAILLEVVEGTFRAR